MQEIGYKRIDITKLSALDKFSSFFKTGEIEKIAIETGFIVRSSSRLSGEAFLKLMVQPISPDTEWSLNDQCDYLSENFGINITKQSLDERYHTFSVAFLKRCYDVILNESIGNEVSGLTSSFSGIYVTDGTSFQLPKHLAAFYKSNGGDTSGSSIKIHQSIELLRFKIADFVITDGKDNDGNYWKNKGFELNGNSLWIGDLGYFSWDTLAEIDQSKNYFLSRYKTGTVIYIKNDKDEFEVLDLEDYVGRILPGNAAENITIYFGRQKTQCRLICGPVRTQMKASGSCYFH